MIPHDLYNVNLRQNVPFSITFREDKINEAHWRIMREECKKNKCKPWKIKKGKPVWWDCCTDDCKAYTFIDAMRGK